MGPALRTQAVLGGIFSLAAAILLCRGKGPGRLAAGLSLVLLLVAGTIGALSPLQVEPGGGTFVRALLGELQLAGLAVAIWQRAGRGRVLLAIVLTLCAVGLAMVVLVGDDASVVVRLRHLHLALAWVHYGALGLLALVLVRRRWLALG